MLMTILQQVPGRIWILLLTLIALGLSQTMPRRRKPRSATILPAIMIALSFYGVVSAFPTQPLALASWAAGVAAAVMLCSSAGTWSGIQWSEAERRLLVPGSWVPLALILGLFAVKFGVGVALAMHPELARNTSFATWISLAYGLFSGGFLARGVAMWKVANQALQRSVFG
ncbi:MAG: hypothetical protein JSS58_00300 [Proteobacteria bacterium]|nr:hypothetical protein [Pseudomonadota bacterium]